jgi:superkiller protein 3
VYLASALLKKEDIDRAFAELDALLRLTPNDPWAHMCLGNIYLKLMKPDEATISLKKASELNPAYLNNLGIVYLKQNMYDEALSTFEKAVAMKQDNQLTYTYLGIIYEKKGDLDKAALMYKKARGAAP